ncbi:MAG: hypothetical protein DCF15_00200 [Phormidesmis priestleyi]|uniref:Uncharacterized protein n=1 Tax=Phormidesmis priestleyi TaxID=268141 RepID=A0A2W5A2D6_9CYAN|nr:MAG: hypothetical protein DCF15_00200 [Phormidesmis priestleyi]
MAKAALPQLQEIESVLAAQETSMSKELSAIQEKLKGIRIVMSMFDGSSAEGIPNLDASTLNSVGSLSSTASEAEASSLEEPEDSEESEEFEESTDVDDSETVKTAVKKRAEKSESKQRKKVKKDGRAATWQKYTRTGVKQNSIPEAVRLVLETQPDKSFKIIEIMEALFEEGMPKAQYLKARNRISNVLSGGVRDGEWHRGERSSYRLSEMG